VTERRNRDAQEEGIGCCGCGRLLVMLLAALGAVYLLHLVVIGGR